MNNLRLQKNGPESMEYIHTSQPQWDNNSVLDKNTTFKIENYGLIKMFFIKATVTPNGFTDYPLPSAPYLYENIFLECNGMAIARVNTTYNLSRIDDLQNTGLYTKIRTSSSFSGDFDSVQTIALPLFFYVIDNQTFNPGDYDNLTVRVITKSTIAGMGLDVLPLSINLQLITVYDQYRGEIPKIPLKDSYNIFSESYPVENASTSKIIQLNNQSKVKSLIFMIRANSDGGVAVAIDSVKLRFTNGTEQTYDNLTNYNLQTFNGTNDGKIFKIPANSYLKMNGNMRPVTATVNFNSIYTATLYVVYEYSSVILQEGRMLMETFEESLYSNN